MPADLHTIDRQNRADDVVETLEGVLLEAQAGRVSSVGIALVYRDGSVRSLWSTLPSTLMMLGAIVRLAHKLNLLLDETSVEKPFSDPAA